MTIQIEAIFMASFLALVLGIIIFTYDGFNKRNLLLLATLIIFWVANNLAIESRTLRGSWELPILISVFSFTQVAFRLPLGIWSQKIRSRKIPILTTSTVMILFSIPMFIEFNFISILFASIGAGAFAATGGMQYQTWSENWNIRNVFATTGIILIASSLGRYIADIIDTTEVVNTSTMKWILLASILTGVLGTFVYLFNKEDKNTIHLDNMSSVSEEITPLGLKHVLIMGFKVATVAFSLHVIQSNIFAQVSDFKLFNALIKASGVLFTLLILFVLIKFMRTRWIMGAGLFSTWLGLILILASVLSGNKALGSIGYVITVLGAVTYINTMFANVLHFDHKNALLVLGIWLTVRSFAIGTGDVILGEVQNYKLDSVKYLIVPALTLVTINVAYSAFTVDGTEVIYDMVDKIEKSRKLRVVEK